jgi:L-arabinose transport system ATP-binding protein
MSGSGLSFSGITMEFPGVKALEDVSFSVQPGTIHALMGENGAGKSTLLKILSGAHVATAGTLTLDGAPRRFGSTADALAAGVAVIYQELHLVPEMTVAENIFLGHLPARGGWVDRTALRAAARQQLQFIGEDIDPATRLGDLPLAQRQMVEIAKALSRGARIIAFDEPTSSLSEREVQRLFAIIRGLRDRGCAVLYVSHRMDEIFALCDRITILRDGRHVETTAISSVSRDDVVQRMVGRKLADIYNHQPRTRGPVRLAANALTGPGLSAPCSFAVHGGEILGVFGLVGAGRSELLKLLFGAAAPTDGTLTLDGAAVTLKSPRDAIAAGIVLCPEDRKKEGIIPCRSVLENINLSARRRTARGGAIIAEAWERENAARWIERLRIRTPSPSQLIRHLSGGNQQKAIIGRWLSEEVRVFLFDEPTRGIDVGAKSEIYALLQRLAADGAAVIVVSSELPEVLGVADRIAIMRGGALVDIIARSEATEEIVLKKALPQEISTAA